MRVGFFKDCCSWQCLLMFLGKPPVLLIYASFVKFQDVTTSDSTLDSKVVGICTYHSFASFSVLLRCVAVSTPPGRVAVYHRRRLAELSDSTSRLHGFLSSHVAWPGPGGFASACQLAEGFPNGADFNGMWESLEQDLCACD